MLQHGQLAEAKPAWNPPWNPTAGATTQQQGSNVQVFSKALQCRTYLHSKPPGLCSTSGGILHPSPAQHLHFTDTGVICHVLDLKRDKFSLMHQHSSTIKANTRKALTVDMVYQSTVEHIEVGQVELCCASMHSWF